MKKFRSVRRRLYATCALVIAGLSALPLSADVSRASDWIGRVVLTEGGELLGRVEDFALNESMKVQFVVVSVGSFLVDDNLIAVDPAVLQPSQDGEYLRIPNTALAGAPRFNDGSWPDEAQIFARQETAEASGVPPMSGGGSATIESRAKRATLSSGQARPTIEVREPVATPAPPAAKRYTQGIIEDDATSAEFIAVDANEDGYIDRRELGARLKPGQAFSDIDLDGNGGIDVFEFRVLREAS